MGREAFARRHAILVDDPQRGELNMCRVVIVGEGKRVPGIEPAVIGVPAVIGLAQLYHVMVSFWLYLFIYAEYELQDIPVFKRLIAINSG
jgi:hypothetical protein